MLACRLCRVPLSAALGCDVCNTVRQNLVAVGEDEMDRPSLGGTASELVSLLRGQLSHLRDQLKANPASSLLEKRAMVLGNTLAKVLESSRKLQVDGTDAVNAMSFQERAELFVGWYVALPPAYRENVRARFAQYEADVSKPLKATEPILS